MCGRFSLISSASAIKLEFGLSYLEELTPRYNIAPGQEVLFLCSPEPGEPLQPIWLRWGLIPHWAKDRSIGNRLANARGETVAEKPAFRQAFRARRGLMIMSGFFEWTAGIIKQPYYFKPANDNLLAIAAIWESWQSSEGEVIRSCCLITTEANNEMQGIHNRMPVILDPEGQSIWVNHSSFDMDKLRALIKPASMHLEHYPVTRQMNVARFNNLQAVLPLVD